MAIQRPTGPIGHCSAKLRRALAIEEKKALGRTVRIRKAEKERASDKAVRGNRWVRPANFSVPGAFHTRFVSADGKVTFHFSVQAVSKTTDGGCRISTRDGGKRLTRGAPAEHDSYIERPGAVMALDPANFDGYADRPQAVETIGAGRAVRSNIADTLAERQRYWRAVHAHERTPGPDRLTFTAENAARSAWRRLADTLDVPTDIRTIAAGFARAEGKRKARTVTLQTLAINHLEAKNLVASIAEIIGGEKRKEKGAVRLSMGRGGRSQYRLTAEFPDGLDAAGRLAVMNALCEEMEEVGLMYVAAIHAPDHHNDRRNHHLHIAFHDRPAKMIGDRWDFEVTEKVIGQHERVRYPHRQEKVAEWSRDPNGQNHRKHGSEAIGELREFFANICNEELDRLGLTRKLDPGSLKSLGSERQPQKRLGTRAAPLEAAGVPTSTGIRNAELLWSALLRENEEEAKRRAKHRAAFRRRIEEAEHALMKIRSVTTQGLAIRLGDLGERLSQASSALDAHESELGEYDITLAMARARPAKVLDTCRNILSAIQDGKANCAEQRASVAIQARANEAEAFLAGIADVDRGNAAVITRHRKIVAGASGSVDAIIIEASTCLERDVPAALTSPRKTPSDERATLEKMFERIMRDDMPILLPDEENAVYRVPGISRNELRAVTSPPFAHMAQKRLAALADEQAKRMRAAACVVGTTGLPELERAAAAGKAEAARTLQHARAYAEHPTYCHALADAQVSPTAGNPGPRHVGKVASAAWASMRSGIANLARRLAPDTDATVAAPIVKGNASVQQPELHLVPPARSVDMSRAEVIDALAAALLTDSNLRVVKRQEHLIVDASRAPDWQISVAAFDGEAAVQAAVVKRFASPWLDVPAADPARLLKDLGAALLDARTRPLNKIRGQWQVDLADKQLGELVTCWRGFDALDDVLVRADGHWFPREHYADNCPTSVIGVGRTEGGQINPARDLIPERSTLVPVAARSDFGRDRGAER